MVKKLALFIAFLFIAGAAGIYYFAKTGAPPGEIQRAKIEDVKLVVKGGGRVEGKGEKPVAFGFGGRLDDVCVKEGQELALNEDIAHLNSTDVDNQIKQAEAAVQEAQAQLDVAKAGYPPELISQAEQLLNQASADVKVAEAKLNALLNPPPPEPTPKWQIDDATRAIEAARLNLEQAELELRKIKAGPSPDDVAVSKAKLAAAEGNLDSTHKRLAAFKEGFLTPKDDKGKIEAEIQIAQSAVNVARAEVDRISRGPSPEDLKAVEIKIALAKNTLAGAESMKERLEKVEPPKPASKYEIEQARAAVEKAKAEELRRKSEVDKLKRGADPAAVKVAEAALQKAQTALDQKKLFKEAARLRAPSEGLVIKRHVEPGMMIAPNQPIVTMTDFSERRVRAEFDVGRMGDIKPGLPVIIKSRAIKEPLDGKVIDIGRVGPRKLFSEDPNAPRGGEVVEIMILITEPKGDVKKESYNNLRPNMSCDAEIILERKENVLVVPKTYVSQEDGKEYVWRVDPNPNAGTNQAPKKQFVKTGMRDEYYVEIINGLSEGDSIMKPLPENGK
ncbi:MAG TPA: HlyD family efflux transporter periplasmic adaptor subunit [Planctomycetota bacterium]|nr:HlyD family efflux transporter periplasmic adaptor subunit [Planctomycetota bacterium]